MNKETLKSILESKGVINVTYKNNPVWLEGISTDKDSQILVKDLVTNEHYSVGIEDLK